MMSKKTLYRITFVNVEAIYEIYAHKISESDLFGFVEIEGLVFGENSSLVVDTSEERLKMEFENVERTLIPLHSVYRIDVVTKLGTGKVRDKSSDGSKVSMFPVPAKR